MNRAAVSWGLVGVAVLGLSGLTWREYRTRRVVERRYQHAVQEQRDLEFRFGRMLETHEQVKADLVREQGRADALEQALTQARADLEATQARLAEETRTVRELQGRMVAMQGQMDQLQGELVVALDAQPSAEAVAPGTGRIELERVVVNRDDASVLEGRVLSVHPDWNFVVVDLGWDQVSIGETLEILHQDEPRARARVERIQEGVCAATILPDWKISDVQLNDSARVL